MTATPFTEIPITVNTVPLGQQLLKACNALQQHILGYNTQIAILTALAAKANTMISPNGDGTSNYNQVEKQFGITASPPFSGNDTASAGYSLLYQLNTATATGNLSVPAAVAQMLAQVG
jgi:hypothetical protein